MTHDRLHALTDGIFSIVMTLMVLELKLPATRIVTNHALLKALYSEKAILISYFVSFAILFIYWRAHNFMITLLAKNIDINLLSINGIFLFFVGLLPFSTELAGTFNHLPISICFYSANIICIGIVLLLMRRYIEKADSIENETRTTKQRRAAAIRTSLPISFAALAIPVAFASTGLADVILLIGVGFNFFNNAADVTDKYLITPLMNFFS